MLHPTMTPTSNAITPRTNRHPQRATHWQLRTRSLSFEKLPRLMGIVNVTPDSFSDGGRFHDASQAIDHALRLVEEGADLIDVGGESTRPYAEPVDADEERRRVGPVVARLCETVKVPVSIDTSKASVAREAIQAGAEIINDVTGLTGDLEMVPLAAATNAAVCAMHMQGTPQTMQDNPRYTDVVKEIDLYLRQRRDLLIGAGIEPARICLDPGVGFGKTHQHNLTILANCHQFHNLACPLLVGHSRKGLLGKLLGNADLDRMPATVGVSLSLAQQGVQVLRVHDVGPVRQALTLFAATGGVDGREFRLD